VSGGVEELGAELACVLSSGWLADAGRATELVAAVGSTAEVGPSVCSEPVISESEKATV
jgi:hypothetical protein